jgi:hypothetical protein
MKSYMSRCGHCCTKLSRKIRGSLRLLNLFVTITCSLVIVQAQTINKQGSQKGLSIINSNSHPTETEALFISDARYGPLAGTPDQMARTFLQNNLQPFKMKSSLSDVVLSQVQESPAGFHVRYYQTYDRIPVYQSDVVVSIDKRNYVEFVTSNFRSTFAITSTTPQITSSDALTIARNRLGVSGVLFGEESSELMIVVEKNQGRLVYRSVIPSFSPRGDWEVLVDAISGEVISVVDMTKFHEGPGKKKPNFLAFTKSLPIISAKPAIQDLVNQVSAASITSNMRRLEAFKSRYVGSAEGRDSLGLSRDWIIAKLQSYGYTDIVQHNFTYGGNTLQNIIATKIGTRYPDSIVILGGHYDTVNGPGADDNGSGTSLILEAARILGTKNFEYTIKFIFFSAEEQGLVGSTAYINNVVVPGNYKIRVMINADMIGYSGGGNIVKVEKDTDQNPPGNNAASALVTDTLAALTELYSTLTTQITSAYASDYMSFEDAGYVITGFFETPENPHYHTASDSLRYADTNYVTQITKGAIAGVAHFARITSGSGYVFDPDPLSTAHATYGDPGFTDNNDADSPQLNAQRQLRILNDLTFTGGLYRLQGPYAYIEDWDLPTMPPVTAANPDSFRFRRSQSGFEDVMVYYHIDKTQRWIQSLGFNNIQNMPFHADPHGENGQDNSAYYPSANKISYGDGGVDDAEDADVILHEYGHAIQNATVPGWSGSGEQGSLGEGFGDYWAESYGRRLHLWQSTDPAFYWVFHWDGHNTFWPGRILNDTRHYPEGLTGAIHDDGQMWSSTLMNIWNDIGYEVLDRLVLQSHFYLPSSGATMAQNAQAVIQADRNLYDGAHVQTLVYWFGQRGFINSSDYVPSIVHTPHGDSENPLGPYTITATIYPGGASLDTNYIKVFWGRTGAFTDSISMVRTGNLNEWTTNIPGNGNSATYQYYIKVKDIGGAVATHPANAPTMYHTFYVGDDITKPVIVHTPLRNQPKLRWPPTVKANVTDNFGVDTVWSEFIRVRGNLTGSFGLHHTSDSTYETLFGLDSSEVQMDDTIKYKILAKDISAGGNLTTSPATGYYTFVVISTKGFILIVDDGEVTKAAKNVAAKGIEKSPALEKEKTSQLMARTLTNEGYLVDTVSFVIHDPGIYSNYDIVVWSGGIHGYGIFDDAAKRAALVNRANNGGKIWIEGGEVGYEFRSKTGELDKTFRQQVLHDSGWVSDVTSSKLTITKLSHAIFNIPNTIVGQIAFTGTSYTVRDAMTLLPGDAGTYKVAGWSTYSAQGSDTAGTIIYDNNTNPLSAQIVFFPFAIGEMTDTAVARKLVENTAAYLMTNEPPPIKLASISGVVFEDVDADSVKDTDEHGLAGWKIYLSGTSVDSQVTDANGRFMFDSLAIGSYTVREESRSGWVRTYPASGTYAITLASGDSIIGKDFGNCAGAIVRGRVFYDLNNNGSMDSNEPGFAGWKIRLSGAISDSSMSDVTGNFSFNILVGTYTVSQPQSPLTCWVQTVPAAPDYYIFTVDSSGKVYTCDFGFYSSSAMELSIQRRWNMISVPMQVEDGSKFVLFPSASSVAYMFAKGYKQVDTLLLGTGYWLKFPAADKVWICGSQVNDDTVEVTKGWNLIGSVSSNILVSALIPLGTGIQSLIFEYDNGYQPSDTIKSGKAYWVKVDADGKLILSSGTAMLKPVSVTASRNELSGFNKLVFKDANGYDQTLYFGGRTKPLSSNAGAYDLPPVPPAGIFDARFTSERVLEFVDEKMSSEFPIVISSPSFPVTVSWVINEQSVSARLKIHDKEVSMQANGETQILETDSPIILKLAGTRELPQSFILGQNYPNPFNPNTIIKYQLPLPSKVRITIYNVLGQDIKTLVDERQDAGYKSVEWNATDVPSGVYLYRLDATSVSDPSKTFIQVMKMLLVK